jgi:hypothetical protein
MLKEMLSKVSARGAVLAILVALAGCGGGSEPSGGAKTSSEVSSPAASAAAEGGSGGKTSEADGTASAPSEPSGAAGSGSKAKAAFIERADAICLAGNRKALGRVGAYLRQHRGATGKRQQDRCLAEAVQIVFLPHVEQEVVQIEALGAPPGDEQKLRIVLASLREAAEAASKLSPPSSPGLERAFRRSSKLAKAYGLPSCTYG